MTSLKFVLLILSVFLFRSSALSVFPAEDKLSIRDSARISSVVHAQHDDGSIEQEVWKRALDGNHDKQKEHNDHHDDHDDDHHDGDQDSHGSCGVTGSILTHEFVELAEEMVLMGSGEEGEIEVCSHVGEEHGHEEEGHDKNSLVNSTSVNSTSTNVTCPSCELIYDFVQQLLLRLNVTTSCCLDNGTSCEDMDIVDEESGPARTSPAKAYGYGFLLVLLVCLCSLFGVCIIPLLKKNKQFHNSYKYFYALMIALGTSALFCDAILHLLPEAFGIHEHSGDAHEEDEHEEEDKEFIWKGIIVIAGLYLFYLFEVVLHSWNNEVHHHQYHHHGLSEMNDSSPVSSLADKKVHIDEVTETALADCQKPHSVDSECLEPTYPHGSCRDHKNTEERSGILHPTDSNLTHDGIETQEKAKGENKRCCEFFHKIKPLAWIVILGDAIHNLADGLALGAAISQSLSLGLSTAIAIVFHELPHEFGDFAILLSTGMSWYAALFFNFMSSLTAIVGFFIGVSIGTKSFDANGWILAGVAGIFLYVALVDLLPELIHSREKGWSRFGTFIMANIGFAISFVALLLIAIYEDELNTLVNI